MHLASLLSLALWGIAFSAEAAEFRGFRLEEAGARLTIVQSDGRAFAASAFEDQDSFELPIISSNRRYVGWLALFPDRGASYSQPIELVVLDTSKRSRHYAGNFGMVSGWCFTRNSNAVIYTYRFPHGVTSIGFDMRRLKDGKLLHRYLLRPIEADEDESRVARREAPAWTRCAQREKGNDP